MTDVRETIAGIVNSNIFFGSAGVSVGDAATISAKASDAILAALPSIIADMVEPLDFEMIETTTGFKPNSCFKAENDFGQAYIVRGNWAWLPDPDGEGAEPEPHQDPFKFANTHNVATILKALGMKEGE